MSQASDLANCRQNFRKLFNLFNYRLGSAEDVNAERRPFKPYRIFIKLMLLRKACWVSKKTVSPDVHQNGMAMLAVGCYSLDKMPGGEHG